MAESFQIVDRIVRILSIVKDHPDIGLSELSRQAELPKATIHRIVSKLSHEDFLRNVDGRYRLGYRFILFGSAARDQNDVASLAREKIRELRDEVDETVHLAVLSGERVVFLEKMESRQVIRHWTILGEPLPLHASASSKLLAAFLLPWDHVLQNIEGASGEFPRYTANTRTSVIAVEQEFAEIRKKDYAVSIEERYEGVIGIAVPVRGRDETLRAALSLAGPSGRFDADARAEYLPRLRAYSEEIGQSLV